MDAVGDLGGVGFVGEFGVEAHPPSGRSLEGDDFGGGETLDEVGFFLSGVGFGGEGTDLDAPTASLRYVCGERGWVEGLDAHLDDAGPVDAGAFGGGEREIDDAAADKGAAVGDADDGAFAIGKVGDADGGAEREGEVGGGHGVLVVDGSVGASASGVWGTVPAGEADGGVEGAAMEESRVGWREVAGGDAGRATWTGCPVADDGGVGVRCGVGSAWGAGGGWGR